MTDTSDLMIFCLLYLSPNLWTITFDVGKFNLLISYCSVTRKFISRCSSLKESLSRLSYLIFCFISVIGMPA
ncbi:hypothetical protein Bca4012_010272 [Brassica carinata]